MSNCIINIRFGEYHLQVDRDRPWISVGRNDYHTALRQVDPSWRWFQVYSFFGWRG